jgi:hypothetical protein
MLLQSGGFGANELRRWGMLVLIFCLWFFWSLAKRWQNSGGLGERMVWWGMGVRSCGYVRSLSGVSGEVWLWWKGGVEEGDGCSCCGSADGVVDGL